jgi:hypothetical protein|tara:strand:+ start:427 stop:756 length:330 start_codon:yes stop_codon:yes gene_type:complete
MKAICIDSSNKPDGISEEEWIEEGVVYTITEVVELALQDGNLGIALEEVKLTQASAPYKYYAIERFLLVPEDSMIKFKERAESYDERIEEEIKKAVEVYADDADLSTLA